MPTLPIAAGDETFHLLDGVLVPHGGIVRHESAEYDTRGFAVLQRIQTDHFWFRGRHRFVRAALLRSLAATGATPEASRVLDMGGGCGGWIKFLHDRRPGFRELAVADSSMDALRIAKTVAPSDVRCYNVTLHDLPWTDRWDVVSALDVIEHLDDDAGALARMGEIVRPGGLIVVSVPALMAFWSLKDVIARHRRRYTCADLAALGRAAGLEVLDTRYFMFVLSAAAWAVRARHGDAPEADTERRRVAEEIHAIPAAPLNTLLTAAFAAETPLGLHWRFPWGMSALAIYRRPLSGAAA